MIEKIFVENELEVSIYCMMRSIIHSGAKSPEAKCPWGHVPGAMYDWGQMPGTRLKQVLTGWLHISVKY